MARGLDRLITLARKRVRLFPDELAEGDPQTLTALTLGQIYSVLGRYKQSQDFFMMVVSGPTRSGSPAHRAYARLGLARALLPDAGADPVKLAHVAATYQSGVKEHPQGAWHDKTLRELALVEEHTADVRFAPATAKNQSDETPPAAVSDADRRQREQPLRAARVKALPHWTALVERYPQSRHVAQALYHAGILYIEAERPEETVASFERLVTDYPTSPWAGDAHIRLIDVKLERQFDLPAAATHAQAAAVWYAKAAGAKVAGTLRVPSAHNEPSSNTAPLPSAQNEPSSNTAPLPSASNEATPAPEPARSATAAAWSVCPTEADGTTERACYFDDAFPFILPSLCETGYAIYLRAGLAAYLSERPDEAAAFFEQAKPLQPERTFVVAHGEIPTGMERLLDLARSNRQLTPEIIRQGDPKAKLMLMLADVYLESQLHEKTLELATLVIDKPKGAATTAQRSWAHRQRAVAYAHLGREAKEDARREYMAAQHVGPTSSWAPECLLMAGTILHNHQEQRQEALTLFEEVVRRYPASASAAKAAYFVGVIHEWSSQWPQAKAAYQRVIRDYPESRWASAAMNYHLKKVEAALAASQSDNTDGR